MSEYPPGRYRVHDLVTVELRSPDAVRSFFLPGLPAAAGTGPPEVAWDGAPGPAVPLVRDPRDDDIPRSFAAVDSAGHWHLAGPDHDGRLPTQDVLLRRGASLVHGTALAVGGRGVLVLGPPGAGKTALSLTPLRDPEWRLVADDLVVATSDGDLLSTEAPLAIYPEHGGLLSGAALQAAGFRPAAKRGLRAVRSAPVLGPAAQAAKRLASRRGGAVGRWARQFEARYSSIPPSRLFSAERRAQATRLAAVVVLDPLRTAWELAPASPDEVTARLVAETYADGDLHAQLARYGRAGVVDVPRHWRAAAAVLGSLAAVGGGGLQLGVPRRAATGDVQRHGMAAIRRALG